VTSILFHHEEREEHEVLKQYSVCAGLTGLTQFDKARPRSTGPGLPIIREIRAIRGSISEENHGYHG
jgi:hypothetical protein